MVFTVHDFHDLVVLLEKHPEWRDELRRLILTKDIIELPQIIHNLSITVQELAEAQKRTEARVEELAEAQKRTEARVEELAEAQKRTDESLKILSDRVDTLSIKVEELAEAQKRTEARVDELADAQKKTSYQLARLENRIGVSTEEEAADTMRYVLEKRGYRIINGPFNLPVNGEIDVVYQIEDSTGRKITAVLEAKVRLSWRAVEAWAQRMRSTEFRASLHHAGLSAPYLVYAYGMRADPSAHQAAETFGIGLITGRGEEVAPHGEIE